MAAVTFFAIDHDRANVHIVVFGDDCHRLAGLERQIEIRSTPIALIAPIIELHDARPPFADTDARPAPWPSPDLRPVDANSAIRAALTACHLTRRTS